MKNRLTPAGTDSIIRHNQKTGEIKNDQINDIRINGTEQYRNKKGQC
jgi:hypothetical protein